MTLKTLRRRYENTGPYNQKQRNVDGFDFSEIKQGLKKNS